MSDRLKQVSLRKFRDQIADIGEVVEVSKRDADGNIHILGYWTPYMTYPAPEERWKAGMVGIEVGPGQTATLDIPVDDFPVAEFDRHPRTAIIRTPEDAAVAVAVDPVRAVPKPSQRKAKR